MEIPIKDEGHKMDAEKNKAEHMQSPVQKAFLTSESILRYLIGNDDEMDTLIMCKSSEIELITSDFALYEAIASIKPYDDFKLNKLTKFFEVVRVMSSEKELHRKKEIMKDERVEDLRKKALKSSTVKVKEDAKNKDMRDSKANNGG